MVQAARQNEYDPGTKNAPFSTKVVQSNGYQAIAASQTDEPLGAAGEIGDYLAGVLITPATTSPGVVSVKDGAGSSINLFAGGAGSVADLQPFFVPFGAISATGGWSLTTGANVSVVAIGEFS